MNQNQPDTPIQSIEQPILCSPYEGPNKHWIYDEQTGETDQFPEQQRAGYWFKNERTGSDQFRIFQEERRDDLPLVNALREDVKRWREANYRNATPVTRELLRHLPSDDLLYISIFCRGLQYAGEFAFELISYLFSIELPDSENLVFMIINEYMSDTLFLYPF